MEVEECGASWRWIDPARRADRRGGRPCARGGRRFRSAAQDALASQFSGIAFENRDGSSASSAANPGLAGVLVSNGRDVAVTGPDGRYTLPLPEEATIFVIKLAGLMTPIEPLTIGPLRPPSSARGKPR